jgi:hypothetical protein
MKPVLDDDRVTSNLAELARRAASLPVDPALHRTGRARFLTAADRRVRKGPMPTWRMTLWLAPAVALGVLTWILWPHALRYEVLRYEVKGSELAGPYVSAPSSAPALVTFSEGTTLHVNPDGKLRIDEVRSSGARVLIERGNTAVHVAHRHGSEWTFVAGPFEVRVIGTRFDLKWDASAETMDLVLHEGRVEVKSPFGQSPIAIHGGQRFLGDFPHRSTTVVDSDEAPATRAVGAGNMMAASPAAEAASSAEPESLELDFLATGSRQHASHVSQSERSARLPWPKLVASGQFAALVADAERRGIATCLVSCAAVDLRALGDAARYVGKSEVAEQAYFALRQRFHRSDSSRAAAFLLGRTLEAGGALGKAENWYDTYLGESPDGEFAAEALAGKMRAAIGARGPAAGAAIAREYLRRYPDGVHAGAARRVLGRQ